ncbi:MAG: NERD domain-containing protein [Bacillus sp. (in: Bacteria)]|nr:NERD domain-containing protein [Bacillus sp. (in: firmicutes)]
MTIVQERRPSSDLLRMRELNIRKELNNEEQWQLYQLESGYEGELQFDKNFHSCPKSWLVLNNIWFDHGNNNFEIDSLLSTPSTLYNFNVKNFKDEYELIDNKFYKHGNETKTNPLVQIERSDSLLRHLVKQKLKLPFPVVSKITFVNPEFTLFGIQKNHPSICLPSQIKKFFEDIKNKEANNTTTKPTPQQINLVNQLISIQLKESPFVDKSDCDFASLKKGIPCKKCNTFLHPPHRVKKTITCHHCGEHEEVKHAILRNIEKYRLLFPNRPITLRDIIKWCDIIDCEKRVARVLNAYFQRVGFSTATYYVEKITVSMNA